MVLLCIYFVSVVILTGKHNRTTTDIYGCVYRLTLRHRASSI